MRLRCFIYPFLWLVVSQPVFAAAGGAAEQAQVSEVRILIDISGSMKKNDPNNLRAPALKLVTQLLPEGTRAGVWTFGQYVNMLIPSGPVDQAWKAKANDAVKTINSAGMYTNIEGVLKDATWDWNRPDPKTNRNIIFLTDGMLDISKDRAVDEAARSRVLGGMVAKWKSNGVTIHTVALSNEADKPFLKQLSAATSGRYEQVSDAAGLERVFLRMFEKSVPVETLPLTGNKVLVDSSINELTMLVFRKAGAESTSLKTPDGKEITQAGKPANVQWQHEARYDLITIEKPMAGEWRVNAELDPDNRVMVVTDLSVRASRLPNMMLRGDQMPYFIELHNKDKVIDKPEFLDFVTVALNRNYQNALDKMALEDNGKGEDAKARDGRFSGSVGGDLRPGEYDYELLVNGTTFKRSKRYLVQVVEKPVTVNVTETAKGDPAHYSLSVVPYSELIDPETLKVEAQVTKQGGAATALTIPRAGPNEWRLDMDVRKGDRYEVAISVQAKRLNGQGVAADLGSYLLGDGDQEHAKGHVEAPAAPPPPAAAEHAPAAEAPAPEPAHASAPEHAPEQTPQHAPEHAPAQGAEHAPAAPQEHAPEHGAAEGQDQAAAGHGEGAAESPNWIMVAAKVVGVNGVLLLMGFLVYRKFFRKKASAEEGDTEGGTAAAKESGKEAESHD